MKYIFFFLILSLPAVDFKNDIEPIFEENCYKCHGEKKQKSDLRLDLRSSILKGGDLGEPAAHPGHPEKSMIVKLISLEPDHDDIMPPKGDPLTKKQISLISQWVKEGAKMPEKKVEQEQLWSFSPVKKPPLPVTGEKNFIDSFLSLKLKEKGLSFSPRENPAVLLRRLQVILTGLLPTAEESQAFLDSWAKNADRAYSNKVEELLASERFGERWAQHWLDAIRWSETSGSESNLYRKFAWKYRDYVIHSFNKDKPYSRFIIDQIAGDQTGFPRATGFLIAGPHVPPATVGQEPSAVKQARYDRLDQIMQTIGASMMGVTLGCARCHSHKFDPIKISDYYGILANFQGVDFGIRKPELGDHAPEVVRSKKIMKEIELYRQKINLPAWNENWVDHFQIHFRNRSIQGIRINFTVNKANIDELEVFTPQMKNIIKEAKITTNLGGPRAQKEMLFDGNIGSFYAVRGRAPGKEKGYIALTFDKPVKVKFFSISSDRKKINNTDYEIKNKWMATVANFGVQTMDSSGKWTTVMKNRNQTKPVKSIQDLILRYRKEGVQYEFIGRFMEPVKTNVLLRGSPSALGAEVAPAALGQITESLEMDSSVSDKERRMKFAQWLASEKNPLTARVMVNRIWHHTFGTGIVETLSDFGNAGARPSHPQLLDYLASEFAANNWSVKSIIRTLVTSKAFKQSGRPVASALKVDSDARLLWRYPPRRGEAEVLRDSVLKLTGSLKNRIGGIAYRIHNVKKRYALWQVVDNYSEDTWRRMIYQERMRGVDDRMFTAFDFPDCGQVLSKRPCSTTPLQALNLMNSKFIETQCGLLANKVHSSDKAASVKKLFQTVYNRDPDRAELRLCLKLLESEGMNILCRALLNSNEFVFIQ